MAKQQSEREILDNFQQLCIDFATGSHIDYKDYEEARNRVMSCPKLVARVPKWVTKTRFGGHFWEMIKEVSGTYNGRRKFIYESLSPVYEYIERKNIEPSSISFEEVLKRCSSKVIEELWGKIHSRRSTDPEGTITAARSLIESTCKYVLDDLGISYSHKADLQTLYKATAKELTLSPDQHKEDVFRKILGGCNSIANGLAGLRNAFGDAHGKSSKAPKPSERHADLAVNAAGTIATFLIASYEQRKNSTGDHTKT
jgi:Abortive infection C-terminus